MLQREGPERRTPALASESNAAGPFPLFFDQKALPVDCSDLPQHHQFRRPRFDLDQRLDASLCVDPTHLGDFPCPSSGSRASVASSGAPLFGPDISSIKMTRTCVIAIFALGLTGAAPASAREVYLDKVDKNLDNLWNYLDGLCRGGSGDEAATNKACDQRLEVDKIIMKMGCSNIYPATGKNDTSYWKCRR